MRWLGFRLDAEPWNETIRRDMLPIATACGSDGLRRHMIEWIIGRRYDGVGVDEEDRYGGTALQDAVIVRDVGIVEMLLRGGADVHKANSLGATALTVRRDVRTQHVDETRTGPCVYAAVVTHG